MYTARFLSVMTLSLALALAGGGNLLAQQGLGGVGLGLYGVGPRLGENVSLALEFQSELGLSAEQVTALQLLHVGIQNDVGPVEAEMAGLRADIVSGRVNSADGIVRLQGLFEEHQVVSAPYRLQIQDLLTPIQHQTLQAFMWETRPAQSRALGATGLGIGWDAPLGTNQALWVGRGAGVGLGSGMGFGRRYGIGFGRGSGPGLGRSTGVGLGRGRGFGRIRRPGWRY